MRHLRLCSLGTHISIYLISERNIVSGKVSWSRLCCSVDLCLNFGPRAVVIFMEELLSVLHSHVVDLHIRKLTVHESSLYCKSRVIGVNVYLADLIIRNHNDTVTD